MQFKTIFISAFVALAAAESVQELVAQIPDCPKKCLDAASQKIGCASTDNKCQCSKIDNLTNEATACILACSSDDMTKTLTLSTEICAKVSAQGAGDTISSIASVASTAVGGALSTASSAVAGALSTASAKVTSIAGDITATPSHSAPSATASTKTAGVGRNLAGGAGLAAAVLAFAL